MALTEPGTWSIRAAAPLRQIDSGAPDSSIASVERLIEVHDDPIVLSALIVNLDTVPPLPNRREVHFDELANGSIRKMPYSHLGLRWENIVVTGNEFYGGEGYANMSPS